MSSKHLPLIAWSKSELMNELWSHDLAIRRLREEIERRGERDEERHGFAIPVHQKGAISTAYAHYATAVDAYDAARARWPDDETAPYRVHPVYLGKDDPETAPTPGERAGKGERDATLGESPCSVEGEL